MIDSDSSRAAKRAPVASAADLDLVLTAQLAVAWAGERGEEPRLGWWATDLTSEFGGHDLFQRLLPSTWEWAALEGAREAARRRDAELRASAHDPDRIVSLFRLGYELDERVEDRLREHRRAGRAPRDALPALRAILGDEWDAPAFEAWVASHGAPEHTAAPIGRLLAGAPPDDLPSLTRRLIASLAPRSDGYPLPHFRRPG